MFNYFKLPRHNILTKIKKNVKIEELVPPIFFKIKKFFLTKNLNDDYYEYIHPSIETYSWSQEDLILWEIFKNKSHGNFLDIGCNDPILGNNTFKFYKAGWRGINVDIDPFNIDKCNKVRPLDLNLNKIISGDNKKVKVNYFGLDSTLTKIDNYTELNINALSIYELYLIYIKNKFQIDLLSIDTEGTELEILSANNWIEFRPKVIILEINAEWENLQYFMIGRDYLPVYRNRINAIFIDEFSVKTFSRVNE